MATPIQEAEKLISSGNTEKALQLLVKGTSGRFKRKFALLLNRLKRINKQYTQGTLSDNNFQTESNKVSAGLLVALQQYEAHLNGELVGTNENTIKWAIVGVVVFIVGFLGVRYWLQENEPKEETLEIECTGKEHIIYIANAENLDARYDNDNIRFSRTLKGKIESQVESNYYVQGLTENFNYTNRENVESLFDNDSCQVKGIFSNAFYDKSDEICQVYIDVVNLELKVANLEGKERIILDNPPNIQFKINPDAELIANFVIAIAKLYIGAAETSISLFSQIEEKVNLEDQPELKAFVKLSKGNAYILNGDKEKALESYGQIGKEVKYKTATKQNIEIAKISHLIKLADGVVKDKRGGIYPYKKMKDGRNWTIRNLDIETPNSWCYGNDPKNCQKYGRLYTFEAAKKACDQLGDGWRLPTRREWTKMVYQYGGAKYGNPKNEDKAVLQALIEGGNTDFAALLGGRRTSNGSHFYLGTSGFYWTSTEYGSNDAWSYFFGDGVLWRVSNGRTNGHSVRCLQD